MGATAVLGFSDATASIFSFFVIVFLEGGVYLPPFFHLSFARHQHIGGVRRSGFRE